jgi:hypothetical protein
MIKWKIIFRLKLVVYIYHKVSNLILFPFKTKKL